MCSLTTMSFNLSAMTTYRNFSVALLTAGILLVPLFAYAQTPSPTTPGSYPTAVPPTKAPQSPLPATPLPNGLMTVTAAPTATANAATTSAGSGAPLGTGAMLLVGAGVLVLAGIGWLFLSRKNSPAQPAPPEMTGM